MSLAYLKQNPIAGISEGTSSESTAVRPQPKLSKGKFALLLSGNLIVWVIFMVGVMDIHVFSMTSGSLPRIPQKLAVSGIVYSETTPTVILSNQVYGIGDVVDGYTITRITQTEVEFQKGNKKIIRQVH